MLPAIMQSGIAQPWTCHHRCTQCASIRVPYCRCAYSTRNAMCHTPLAPHHFDNSAPTPSLSLQHGLRKPRQELPLAGKQLASQPQPHLLLLCMMLITAQCADPGGARKAVASSSRIVLLAVSCWLLRCCTLASLEGPTGQGRRGARFERGGHTDIKDLQQQQHRRCI